LYGTTIQKTLGIQDYYIEITRNDVPKFEVEYNADYTLAKVTLTNFPGNANIKEYSLNGGKKWISCKNGDVITLKENTTIQTRYKLSANDANYVTGSSKAIVKLNYNIKLEKPTISLTANNQSYSNTTISGYDVLAKFQTPNSDDKTISYETSITRYSLSEIANAGYISGNKVNSSQIKNYKSNSDAGYERLADNINEKKFTEPGVYKVKVRAITHGGFVVSEEQTEIVTIFNKVQYIEDLVDLSTTVNKGYSFEGYNVSLIRDLDFTSNTSYKNASDTSYGDLNKDGKIQGIKTELTNTSGIGFTPIGNSSNKFKGIFDGSGYKIKNIYINSTSIYYVGLFGYIDGAEIKNLGLVDGNVTNILKNTGDDIYVGGIVAYNNMGIINNCYNTGTVSSICGDDYTHVGGIVGTSKSGTIRNCYNTGTLYGSCIGTWNTYDVGGIVGEDLDKTGVINNCYNTGSISSSDGFDCIGGIGGNIYGTISDCYNTGELKGAVYVGGIAGFCSGEINRSYNNGRIIGSDKDTELNKFVGGIAAYGVRINGCHNTGDISGGDYVGGIVGNLYGYMVNNCYNTGNISCNGEYVGGIVGGNHRGETISNCYNKGNITTSGTWGTGGIIGDLSFDAKVINCYNIGNVSNTEIDNSMNVVGGIVGYTYDTQTLIENCYNIGNVSGSGGYNVFDGGIVGFVSTQFLDGNVTKTVKNCYYLSGKATGGIGGNDDLDFIGDVTGSAELKTSTYMKSQAFVTLLNSNKNAITNSNVTLVNWKYVSGNYPQLDM